MNNLFSENRLTFVTLDELNKQRLAAGATPVVAPLTKRIATAAGTLQKNQYDLNTQTNQLSAINQRYNDTQAYFNDNPSVLSDVNSQIAQKNQGLSGMTEEQMRQSTGTFGTPTDGGGTQFVTGQRTNAQDVLSQAGQGAMDAKTRVIQNIADLLTKNKIDNDTSSKILQDWTNTMGTRNLGGTPEAIRQPDGTMKVTAPYDPKGNFRELAASRLREAGKTENEIKTFLESSDYTKAISETMSNTGQGGTFDERGGYISPSKSASILAKEKSLADEIAKIPKTIERMVGYDKNGNPIYQTITDPNYQKNINDLKARIATEEQNTLGRQAQKEANAPPAQVTPPTSTTTPSTTQTTPAPQVGNLNLPNLPTPDPTVKGAFQPVVDQIATNKSAIDSQLQKDLSSIDNPVDQDGVPLPSVSSQLAGLTEELKLAREDSLRRQEDSKNYVLEQAAELKKSQENQLSFTKAQFDLKQSLLTAQQVEQNADNELRNRRVANSMGIAHDTGGLEWMAKEARKGQELLTYLQTSTNIQDAQFNESARSISENYRLNLRGATLDYDAKNAEINSNFSKGIKDLASMVTLDAKEKAKEKTSLIKDAMKQKNDLDMKLAETMKDIGVKSLEILAAANKAAQGEKMSTKDKLGFTSGLRAGIQQNKVISQASEVTSFYGNAVAGYARYEDLQKQIASGKLKAGDVSLAPAQSTLVGALARMLDPQSVVRDAEYERQTKGVAFTNKVNALYERALYGGEALTAVEIKEMKKMADEVHGVWQKRLSENLQPFILDIDDWNSNYPDSQIRYEQAIPNIDRVNLPSQTMSTWKAAAGAPSSSRSGLNANSTLFDFFSVYAPSADNNNPSSYASIVAKNLGVTSDTPIGELRGRVSEFARAIAQHEGFTSGASRLAVENNNPGNLRFIGQAGAVKGRNNFAKFSSVEAGYQALENDILAKIGRGGVSKSYPLGGAKDDVITIKGEEESPFTLYTRDAKGTPTKYVPPVIKPKEYSISKGNRTIIR